IARCQLEPQLQDFLSRHAFHVSNEFTLRNGIGVLGSIAYVLPYQQAREESAETPLCLVLQRNVRMLEIFSFDVELLEDFAQPFDRRIALMTTPTTTCNEAHRQSAPVEIAIANWRPDVQAPLAWGQALSGGSWISRLSRAKASDKTKVRRLGQ